LNLPVIINTYKSSIWPFGFDRGLPQEMFGFMNSILGAKNKTPMFFQIAKIAL